MLLEILCGQIACGKSTYAKKQARQGAIIINDDAIVTMLHGEDYTLYDKYLKPLYKTIETFIIQQALIINHHVVIDRPCHKQSTRIRYISLGHCLGARVHVISFPRLDPVQAAKKRFNVGSRDLTLEHWLEAAYRHEKDYIEPNQSIELFDKIINYNETKF